MRQIEPASEAALRQTVVVVAAFNEAGALPDTVERLLELPVGVVVVDDGSTDGTAESVMHRSVAVLRHSLNLGQGAAIRTGMEYALRRGARYVVTFDADGQHDEGTIPGMIALLESGEAEVVLGSRFLGNSPGMPAARRWLLRAATLFTRLSTGLPLTDVHNGLRGFTAAAVRTLALSQNRMAHASEILNSIGRARMRWREIPTTVRYTDYSRAKGQSSLGAINILYDLLMKRWFP